MAALDPGVVGEWLAAADDAPIPLPWRGEVYEAPPPDGARGKRIAAFLALTNGKVPADDKAMAEVLQGEPLEVLALGRETYDALRAAGITPLALARATNLALIRWGYGSEDLARKYVEAVSGGEQEPEETPAPKSRARSRRRTSRSSGSATRARTAGTPTTSSPKE